MKKKPNKKISYKKISYKINGIEIFAEQLPRGRIKLNKKKIISANTDLLSKAQANTLYKKFLKSVKGKTATKKVANKLIKSFFKENKKNLKDISIKNKKQFDEKVKSYLDDTTWKKRDFQYIAKNYKKSIFTNIEFEKSEEIVRILDKYGETSIGRLMKAVSQYKDIELGSAFFGYDDGVQNKDFIPNKSENFLRIKNSLENIANNLVDKDREELTKIINSLSLGDIQ